MAMLDKRKYEKTHNDPFPIYSMTIIGSYPFMTAPMTVVMPVYALKSPQLEMAHVSQECKLCKQASVLTRMA